MRFNSIFGVALATALVATQAHAQSGTIQFSGAIADPACSLTMDKASAGTVSPSSKANHLIVDCARPASFNAALADVQGNFAQALPAHGHGYGVRTVRLPDTRGFQSMVVTVTYI